MSILGYTRLHIIRISFHSRLGRLTATFSSRSPFPQPSSCLFPPPFPTASMTTLKPDAFEEVSKLLGRVSQQPTPLHSSQIFLKLEEESERRAIEAEEAAHSPNIPDLATAAQRAAQRRQRNRGSVSVSRFGHVRTRSFFLRAVRLILHKDRGRYTTTNKFKPVANATCFCPRHDDILWGQSHVCLAPREPMCWSNGALSRRIIAWIR